MYFYAGEYEKAMSDFEQSSSIMHAQKVLYPRNQFPDEPAGDNNPGSETDDMEIGKDDDAASHESS